MLAGGFGDRTYLPEVSPTPALDHAVIVAKYDRLAELLRHQHGSELRMTFEQLAAVVPGGLPPSAYRYRGVVGQRGGRSARSRPGVD